MVLASPFYPVLLTLRELMLVHASKTYQVSIQALESAKHHVSQFIQVNVGLEAHLQIVISTVLLLLANSRSRTVIGLEALFEQETLFYLPPNLALTFSVSLSLYSCIQAHLKGISKRRVWSTTASNITILIFSSVSQLSNMWSN